MPDNLDHYLAGLDHDVERWKDVLHGLALLTLVILAFWLHS